MLATTIPLTISNPYSGKAQRVSKNVWHGSFLFFFNEIKMYIHIMDKLVFKICSALFSKIKNISRQFQ